MPNAEWRMPKETSFGILHSTFSIPKTMVKRSGRAYYMISAVAQKYNIHPQTLRLYEREGLLKPSRTEGNTRLYSEEDLEQLETILSLTRDLGVNLAGVEIILNMRRRMEQMQREVNQFMEYVKHELARGLGADLTSAAAKREEGAGGW